MWSFYLHVQHICAIWRNVLFKKVEIPMGTHFAPLIADLFLFWYERDFMSKRHKSKQYDPTDTFNDTSLDILTIYSTSITLNLRNTFLIYIQGSLSWSKHNRESTKGYSRWKVEWRHGKFEEFGLNDWSISKSQNGGRNQVSGRVSAPCWLATPVANAPWKPLNSVKVKFGAVKGNTSE